ncbi:hypothetical protein [Streptomyces sp. DSM 40750]|uniref:hypothetical protein n=1 Tax=Streptomyces sp. DSM 40750 TaxID=2801030 RepID=UPI00214B7479|nr:hypothetical protein [Streptomyces sp. DSM 40750]UUU22983.1 hypothetical protein JIX55_23315 [Streptomyces sp. DSM 40750]
MTQSGQGEEPSARTAREGIVLPSDGGAPLHPSDLPSAQLPPAPAQSWEQRQWGPEGAAAAPTPPPADQWNSVPSAPEWGGQGAHDAYGAYGAYGPQGGQDAYGPQGGQGGQDGGMPLPPEGAQQRESYGAEGYGGAGSGVPLPPVAGEVSLASEAASAPPQSAPLPSVDEGATQYIPYVPAAGAMPVDEGATQYIPPVAPAAPAAEAATQYLPPVGPGALPPEASADATTYLGRVSDNRGAGPLPPTANPAQPMPSAPAGNPDAEATQYIPPVPAQAQPQPYGAPGQRQAPQQPDVFDSLFRSEPGAGAVGATQHLPKIEHPYAAPAPQGPGGYGDPGGHGGHGGHGGRASARRDSGGGGGRTGSRVPLIALVGVGIAVLGIGAGALMAGSGDDSSQKDNKPVAATGAPEESASASVDPAKEQAVALDKLLADSGDSRSSVIKAVANIKACTNLGKAATDLRAAAAQRNDLVTRLGELSVDKLPNHAALTTSLTKAWKASASADNHYAAWADQAAGKKGCKKGQAVTTGQTQAGNQASGTASAEKNKAAKLWNSIATTYGLTQRQAVQL